MSTVWKSRFGIGGSGWLRRFPVLFFLVFALSCGTGEKGEPVNPDMSQLRASMVRYLERTGVQSVAVAVAKNGEICWEEGF